MTSGYPPWGLHETDSYPLTVRRRATRGYGWLRDHPDHRDQIYARGSWDVGDHIDLEGQCPHVYDQGPLGSCTGNAIAAAIQFVRMKHKLRGAEENVPSRLFIYFGERVIAGSVDSDTGGSMRDGIKVAVADGTCFEDGPNAWPYEVARFADRPPKACFTAAKKGEVKSYNRIQQNISDMEACLAEGFPFVFGFTAFAALESKAVKKRGALPLPKADDQPVGGHAVMAVGYNRSQRQFKVRNSWGKDWGQAGYFWMPYDYLSNPNLASDFWTIRLMESVKSVK